ncbi:hypothetical protein [Cohnella fermenti]|uniref:Uncharacterized protein n=1 Tax=Cohnella fermenti TaxID=2565925 RepID=A0A4S4C7Y5_9BACL|nr:hypothetical protein [Cohnella fermenti]THF84103.1 hypothetical protein E6C55_01995 [Cohnella fermenti]
MFAARRIATRGWIAPLLGLALLAGCSEGDRPEAKESQQMNNTEQGASPAATASGQTNGTAELERAPTDIDVIMDDHYKNGFDLLGIRSIETGDQVMDVLNYGQPYGTYPFWRLAQWGTKHSLEGAELQTLAEGVYEYSNEAKAVTADTNTGTITLKALASKEYGRPRREGEDWPHLLIEQYFLKTPFLNDLSELRVKGSLRISKFEPMMDESAYNPSLHAAQVSWYLTMQNQNTSSPGYGDYFWFGLPLFDNREPLPGESYFQDGGKEDTTHKFIYNMDASLYLSKSLQDGEWASIDLDILPYVLKARDLAYEGGFLKDTKPSDLAVANMNIGWELPGTFDVELQAQGLSIAAAENGNEQE